MAFEWTDLIGPGLGAAGSLLGTKMQTGATKAGVEEQKREFDIKTGRSDQARNMLMPVLQRSLGARAPMMGGAGMTSPGLGAYGQRAPLQMNPQGGGAIDTAQKAAGIASGVGFGLGGLVPGLAAMGPIGALAGAGLGAYKLIRKIGAGRRAADKLTGPGGAQYEFGQDLNNIASRGLPMDQTRALLSADLEAKIQQAMEYARQGPNQAKVVRQWLGSFSSPDWMRDHPELNPIAQKYLGSMG